jgi:hypothetical protein
MGKSIESNTTRRPGEREPSKMHVWVSEWEIYLYKWFRGRIQTLYHHDRSGRK